MGDLFDRRIPEFDFFIVLLASETSLRDVVVSRDDILKHAPAALAAGAPPDASAKPDSAISYNEIVSLYRSLIGPAKNREEADAIVQERFGPISKETRTQARKEAGFSGKSGRPKKTGK